MSRKLTTTFDWPFDRAELIADGVIHAIGGAFAIVGAIVIVALAAIHAEQGVIVAAVAAYAVALVAMLWFSAMYNTWPVSPIKWVLRRFDHSAIYLMIAGTYTPFIARLKESVMTGGLLVGIWVTAGLGILIKVVMPGRFDRLAIALYLLLGWSGVMVWQSLFEQLPPITFWLLGAGGVLYTVGVIFHVWNGLRFQNAIWHAFVLAAAACHYAAVMQFAALG